MGCTWTLFRKIVLNIRSWNVISHLPSDRKRAVTSSYPPDAMRSYTFVLARDNIMKGSKFLTSQKESLKLVVLLLIRQRSFRLRVLWVMTQFSMRILLLSKSKRRPALGFQLHSKTSPNVERLGLVLLYRPKVIIYGLNTKNSITEIYGDELTPLSWKYL